MRANRNFKGFTLIELIVVIGILAILLSVTLIAINPSRQFAQANDTKRRSDVLAILNAINQYSIDNGGELPGDGLGPGGTDLITSSAQNISNTDVNICFLLVTRYLAGLPTDPLSSIEGEPVTNCAVAYDTEYTVRRNGDRVIVTAPEAQIAPLIEVSR
jgi:prepilin-type N-terminal cleavage/methylation domain-containing protein